jgi:shikimate kinase
MKIILIGFMGTGKTSVAPILASKLGLESIEMDDLIIRKASGKSVGEIFEAGGETYFRELEAAVGADLRNYNNAIISTGGGVVMDQTTMDSLASNGIVIGLSGSFDTIRQRIGRNMPRPLFQNLDQAKALYELREPLYSKYAAIRVSTDNKSPEEVADEIINKVQKP